MAQSAGKETSFKAASSKLNAADGETVYAYYPYSESSESKDHIALPVMVWQNYTNDVTKLDFVYTTGKVADNKLALQFKHLLAFIKLTIPLDLIPDRGGQWRASRSIIREHQLCLQLLLQSGKGRDYQ